MSHKPVNMSIDRIAKQCYESFVHCPFSTFDEAIQKDLQGTGAKGISIILRVSHLKKKLPLIKTHRHLVKEMKINLKIHSEYFFERKKKSNPQHLNYKSNRLDHCATGASSLRRRTF